MEPLNQSSTLMKVLTKTNCNLKYLEKIDLLLTSFLKLKCRNYSVLDELGTTCI